MISRISNIIVSKTTQEALNYRFFYNQNNPKEVALQPKIYNLIKSAVNKPKCSECFEVAGALPIVKQTPLIIVAESVFTSPEFDYEWADKIVANSLRDKFYSARHIFVKVYTANDVTTDEPYNGKRYIGLTNRGINEVDDHFSVTLIHALLHSGGIKGKGKQGSGLHDLIFLGKKYDDVIESCQDYRSRVGKAVGKGEDGQ